MKFSSEKLSESSGEFITKSAEETIDLGRELGRLIEPPLVVLLCGELGAGKTTLTKGIAVGLGVENRNQVNSPTFVLINEYQGRCKIYHVDLYRLDTLKDLASIGLEDILRDDAVVMIEWGEKVPFIWENSLIAEISDLGGDERKIKLSWTNHEKRSVIRRPSAETKTEVGQ